MAASGQRDTDAGEGVPSGALIDVQTRSVQQMNGTGNCLGTNLSKIGARMIGIGPDDDVRLYIYDDAVVVKRG